MTASRVIRAEVQAPHPRHVRRERERRHVREAHVLARHELPFRQSSDIATAAAPVVARPRVELDEQRTGHPPLLGEVDEVAILICVPFDHGSPPVECGVPARK